MGMDAFQNIKWVSAEEENLKLAAQYTADAVAKFAPQATFVEHLIDAIPRIHAAYMAILTSGSTPIAKQEPAVPVKKSVTDDYIICLEDGEKFKSMRRHLYKLGMTPDDYRKKWGLPDDYPMTSPAYSAKRSQLAKDSGLGRK
jgi:predicted transcriptional regulator